MTAADAVEHAVTTRTMVVLDSTVVVPLTSTDHGDADGVLILEAVPTRPFDAYLLAFALLVASAVSGALQHSLFTAPPEPDHLHLVVRYQPAAEDLEIGGDWHDAFLTKDGATTLVIGDVTGHDYHAAAAMGQPRGLIRAIAYDNGQPPATVLQRTDEAIEVLNPGDAATATAVVALCGGHTKTLDELADHVLATLAPGQADDDVALALVRPYPENRPSPPEAGPNSDVPGPIA